MKPETHLFVIDGEHWKLVILDPKDMKKVLVARGVHNYYRGLTDLNTNMIYVERGCEKDINTDDRLPNMEVLGHEIAHVLYGKFHKNDKPF